MIFFCYIGNYYFFFRDCTILAPKIINHGANAVGEIDERFEDLGIISSEVPPASQLESIENHREKFISKVVDKCGILVGFQLMSILNIGFKWDRKLKNQEFL